MSQTASSEIDDVLNQFKIFRQEEAASITEPEFIQYLLPILYNSAGLENMDQGYFLDIAGNPHRPINVTDIKTKEVLFTVPPLMARLSTIDYERGDLPVGGFPAIAEGYAQRLRLGFESEADIFLTQNFRHEVHQLNQDRKRIAEEALKAWVKIYVRYNIPLEKLFNGITPTKVGPAVNETAAKKENLDDSTEFADL